MCEQHNRSVSFGKIGYNQGKVHSIFYKALTANPSEAIVILSIDGPKIVGVFLGTITETTFSDEKIAIEQAFWLLPGYRKSRRPVDLLEAFEYWAKNIAKVSYVLMSETPLEDKTPRSYDRLGYTLIENNFLKKV